MFHIPILFIVLRDENRYEPLGQASVYSKSNRIQ